MEYSRNDLNIIKNVLKEYYEQRKLYEIEDLSSREFGFGINDDKPNKRHCSFENIDQLYSFLNKTVPISIHYSIAKYETPWFENMDKKMLYDVDFIIDIDVQPNENENYYSVINRSKQKLFQLIERLEKDLSIRNYRIFFSGNRGFHVQILEKEYINLSPEERIELLNFLSLGKNSLEEILSSLIFKIKRIEESKIFFTPIELKVLQQLIKLLLEEDIEKISVYFSKRQQRFGIIKILERINSGIKRGDFKVLRFLPLSIIKDYFPNLEDRLSLPLDNKIVIDAHHLLRYPYSLNPKVGLLKILLDKNKIFSFNPIISASPVDGDKIYLRVRNKKGFEYLGIKTHRQDIIALDAKTAFCIICLGAGSYVRGEFHI